MLSWQYRQVVRCASQWAKHSFPIPSGRDGTKDSRRRTRTKPNAFPISLFIWARPRFLFRFHPRFPLSRRRPFFTSRYLCRRGSALRRFPLPCLWPRATAISAEERGREAQAARMSRSTCASICTSTCATAVFRGIGSASGTINRSRSYLDNFADAICEIWGTLSW